MTLKSVWDFLAANWGNIASVLALAVSIATLVVATKAKDAANAARAEARRRSLAEELQDAQRKAEQVGFFVRDRKWELVFLRSQEVTGACILILERWQGDLGEHSKERILKASVEADSIGEVASRTGTRAPTDHELRSIAAAQRRVHQLLSGLLGQSLSEIEGRQ